MSTERQKGRTQEFDPEKVREVSVAVYKVRLIADSGDDAVERMIERDKDGGKKLAGRAAAYDPLTRAYMRILSRDEN